MHDREPQTDPPDLLEGWLETAEAFLSAPRVSTTELETCRIALRKYARQKDPKARAMLKRLDEAEERAWSFKR